MEILTWTPTLFLLNHCLEVIEVRIPSELTELAQALMSLIKHYVEHNTHDMDFAKFSIVTSQIAGDFDSHNNHMNNWHQNS